ncbi:hypothetical protein JAAARDRAFT_36659 [Jaapia argillacea MUCL 33604]|uniref:AB hydrolase-1 domain-containing protein n=1 Tax=Jaapia argillacea MUCL 33604 TaxID=933084 RepID=A0A067PM24_9AGAM|nr:hypothetical protein JAAARDRAFT_36659 [Jaapia argillacea MUCL 33604]
MAAPTVPSDVLHPLSMACFTLDYRREGSPLQVVAKRFSDPKNHVRSDDPSAITILLASGIGLTTELWIPMIKQLYLLNAARDTPARIRSVWGVDCPNHGDAGILNEAYLKEHFAEHFSLHEYGNAIKSLVTSGLLTTEERSNLVALGHCGGAAGIVSSALGDAQVSYRTLILVEPPWLSPEALPAFEKLVDRIRLYSSMKPRVWPSIEEAMEFAMAYPPSKSWHPDALDVMAKTSFRKVLPSGDCEGGVGSKTTVEQEVATFARSEDAFEASHLLRPIIRKTPTHLVLGARQDFWPKPINKVLSNIVESHRVDLASVSVVDSAGHYIPQEKPGDLAGVVFQVLAVRGSAKL